MTNIFAIRATDPKVMLKHPAPIGLENNDYLRELSMHAGLIIAAWGTHGGHKNRDKEVLKLIQNIYHLGLTKAGKPKHPLYLRADTQPVILENNHS